MKKRMILCLMVIVLSLVGCTTGKTDGADTAATGTAESEGNEMENIGQIEFPDANTTIFIDAGDHKIPAVVTIPKEASGGSRIPAVIMLHATGADKNGAGDGFKNIAPQLAAEGIASIRIDFMGSGESTEDYTRYSYSTAISDVDTTAGYLVSLGVVDPERIGLLGWSQGGTDALLAAAGNDTYASVVTWAGSINLGHLVTDQMRADAQRQGYAILTLSFGGSEHLGKQWIDQVDAINVLEKVTEIKVPILAIAGTRDTIVPPQAAADIVSASTNAASMTYIIENADHVFNVFSGDAAAYEKLCRETINWFKETL